MCAPSLVSVSVLWGFALLFFNHFFFFNLITFFFFWLGDKSI